MNNLSLCFTMLGASSTSLILSDIIARSSTKKISEKTKTIAASFFCSAAYFLTSAACDQFCQSYTVPMYKTLAFRIYTYALPVITGFISYKSYQKNSKDLKKIKDGNSKILNIVRICNGFMLLVAKGHMYNSHWDKELKVSNYLAIAAQISVVLIPSALSKISF